MFFFAAGAVALFVHNLCTFGFFCLSIYCLLFIDQKKKKTFLQCCTCCQYLLSKKQSRSWTTLIQIQNNTYNN